MISSEEVDLEEVSKVYNVILDALTEMGATKPMAICGTLAVAAVQTKGGMIPIDELIDLVNTMSEWLITYVAPPKGQLLH